MTKQFKLGEYAIGGIIRVENKSGVLKISALDYYTKQPIREHSFASQTESLADMELALLHMTSCYYTDKIMNHIQTKML